MITVSLIQEYLYCPMKVYMKMQDYDIKNGKIAITYHIKQLLALKN
ncbi:MAG TPA: hypothetical protein VF324_10120 [Methanobacterium sp.]